VQVELAIQSPVELGVLLNLFAVDGFFHLDDVVRRRGFVVFFLVHFFSGATIQKGLVKVR